MSSSTFGRHGRFHCPIGDGLRHRLQQLPALPRCRARQDGLHSRTELDQLFGVSSSPTLKHHARVQGPGGEAVVPPCRKGGGRYLARSPNCPPMNSASRRLHARVDKLAARLRLALAEHPEWRDNFDDAVAALKSRIVMRSKSVAQQNPEPETPCAADRRITASVSEACPSSPAPAPRPPVRQPRQQPPDSPGDPGASSKAAARGATSVLLTRGTTNSPDWARVEKLPADARARTA